MAGLASCVGQSCAWWPLLAVGTAKMPEGLLRHCMPVDSFILAGLAGSLLHP